MCLSLQQANAERELAGNVHLLVSSNCKRKTVNHCQRNAKNDGHPRARGSLLKANESCAIIAEFSLSYGIKPTTHVATHLP